jgi:RHS repeat-associated protein
MRFERGSWIVIGWMLLILGGWSAHAHAQEVPSRDVGQSTYFVPVMPGGSANLFPYFADFKYQLPLFRASGVGHTTNFGLTYNTANLRNPNITALGFGWTTDYFMRITQAPPQFPEDKPPLEIALPWGEMARVFESDSGDFQLTRGYGFVAQIVKQQGGPDQFAMMVDGGTAYLFKLVDPVAGMCVLRSIVDPVGNRIDIVHNGNGRPIQIIDQVLPGSAYPGAGRTTTIEYYPAQDLIQTIIDPVGNRYEFGYTAVGTVGNRLTSIQFPPIVIDGMTQTPTYKFQYYTSGSGLLSKIIPPRGAANGDYGYDIQYYNNGGFKKVIDPPEAYISEPGATGTFEVFYQSEQLFWDAIRSTHTKVKDRRGNSTVYVFNTNPFATPMGSYLLSEIWDPVALNGVTFQHLQDYTTATPGIFPILAEFDKNFNLTKLKDRWGNKTFYEFKQNAPFAWMQNLLERVKKPGPGGTLVTVEEFDYTADVFANVWKHRTFTGSGVRETEYLYDAFGRIATTRHPDVMTLPDAPPQTSVTTQYFYESGGRRQLNRVVNERGHSTYFQNFDPVHGLPRREVRDGAISGQFTETLYDVMGNVVQTKQAAGEAGNDPPGWEITQRDSHYRVKTVTDPSGITSVTNEYDLDGNLTKITPVGDATTATQAQETFFDKRGFVVGGTGPDGTWSQMVDANGNVREERGVRFAITAAVATTTYDSLSRVSQETVPGGSVFGTGGGGGPLMTTTYAYDVLDGSGALCDTVTRVGGTDPSRVTKIFYDHRRRKVQEVRADGLTSTKCFYDEQDHLVGKETLYGGVVQSCEVTFRDERDRVFRVRSQNAGFGGTPTLVSDAVTIPNEMGTVVEQRGALWNPAFPNANRMVNTVDARERVTEVRDGFGVLVTRNTYGDDDLVSKVEITDPATKSTAMVVQETRTYTARKELKEVFNRDGVRASLTTYRVRKGVIHQVTDASGVITETTYHPLTWRVDEVIVAKGVFEAGQSLERRTKSIWTHGLLSETKVWNPAGVTPGGYATPSVHKYYYDQADRIERTESPGGILAAEQTFYNAFSEIDITVVGPSGSARVGDHTYNLLGQLEQTVWTGPDSATEVRTYNEIGLPDSITALTRSEESQYENWLGTLDKQTFYLGAQPWLGGTGPTLDYTYDAGRNLTRVEDREGARHEWQYDANGRVWSIDYQPPGQTLRPVVRITYTPGGLIDKTTLHDAAGAPIAVTTNTYDGRGRKVRQQTVQSSTQTVVADLVWEYNDLNLITKIKYQHLGVESTLLYNARQEVKSESISSNGGGQTPPPYDNQIGGAPAGPESVPSGEASGTRTARLAVAARSATYVIDPGGNRTSQTIEGVTTTFQHNQASQITIETRTSATQTDKIVHSYDIWGNETLRTTDLNNDLTTDITEIYQYNYLNRISFYSNSATSANFEYSYWPGGDRYSKTNNGTSTSEIYIPKLDDVLADYEQVGAGTPVLKNKYVQGTTTDSKQVRIAADGTRHHFIGDAVGTVSITLTDTGSVEQSAFKDVFGVELTTPLTGERYQGLAQRERDLESGLDHMRARMYDPRLGRFIQMDPMFANRASEHYVYGGNNPVSNVDPQGTSFWNKLRVAGAFVKSLAKDVGSAAVKVAKYAVTHNPVTPWGIYNQTKDAIAAVESTVARAKKVYEVHKAAGHGTVSAIGLTTAQVVADKTGATAIYEGVTGVDTNRMLETGNTNPTLNGTERAVRVIEGVTQVAGTALAVAGGKQMLVDKNTGRTVGGAQTKIDGPTAAADTPPANQSSWKSIDEAPSTAWKSIDEPSVPRGGTYKLRDPETKQVRRTGRTKDLNRREGEHARGEETKDLDFEVDRRSDDPAAQRGREQIIYDEHPEAQKANGGLNKARPIDPKNKKRDHYMQKGRELN